MINGTVEAGRIPVIRLKFRGVGGPDANLIVAVDTCFSEQVSLPQMWIQALALPRVGEDTVTLWTNQNKVVQSAFSDTNAIVQCSSDLSIS